MDLTAIKQQHAENRKIQNRILKWDATENPLAKLSQAQADVIAQLEDLNTNAKVQKVNKKVFASCCDKTLFSSILG